MTPIEVYFNYNDMSFSLELLTENMLKKLKERIPYHKGIPRYIRYGSTHDYEFWPTIMDEINTASLVVRAGNEHEEINLRLK